MDNKNKHSYHTNDDPTDDLFIDLSYLRKVGDLSTYNMTVSDLFDLYKKTNFTYKEKQKRIEKHIQLITNNWEAALSLGNELLWITISKSSKTNAMATISSWLSNNKTWMAQHMASSGDAPGLVSVLLNTLAKTITKRKRIKACLNWYCKDNETASRFYDEIEEAIGKEHSSNKPYEYLNIYNTLESSKSKDICIKRCKPDMRKDLCDIALKTNGRIYLIAEDFDNSDLELNSLNKKYLKAGLARKRYIWLAYYSNKPVGAAICYRGPLGLNFSFFENRCDLLINTNNDNLKEDICLALLSQAKNVYFDPTFDTQIKHIHYPLEYFPVACLSNVYEQLKNIGVEHFRDYNQCYWLREGFENYYRYLIKDLKTCLAYIKRHPEE